MWGWLGLCADVNLEVYMWTYMEFEVVWSSFLPKRNSIFYFIVQPLHVQTHIILGCCHTSWNPAFLCVYICCLSMFDIGLWLRLAQRTQWPERNKGRHYQSIVDVTVLLTLCAAFTDTFQSRQPERQGELVLQRNGSNSDTEHRG